MVVEKCLIVHHVAGCQSVFMATQTFSMGMFCHLDTEMSGSQPYEEEEEEELVASYVKKFINIMELKT